MNVQGWTTSGNRDVATRSDLSEGVDIEASEVLPAPPGHPRFPLLDSLRAFAAISILLVHVGILTGGFQPWYKTLVGQLEIGVPFFFMLSGFLLYRPMLASRIIALPRQGLTAYARNRVVRILPAYWLVLTLAAIIVGFEGAFSENWWVYYGLLQNFEIYTPVGACAVNPFDCALPVAWSLSIEIYFYLLLPFFAIGMAWLGKLTGGRKWVETELAVLILLSGISIYIQSSVPQTAFHKALFFTPLGRFWWFAIGMGVAVISVWMQMRRSEPVVIRWIGRHPNVLWATAAALFAFSALVILDPGPSLAFPTVSQEKYLYSVIISGLISLLILLPAIFGPRDEGFVRRLMRQPAFVGLGLISYGIFLWHYPVMTVMLDLGVASLIPSMQFPVVALATFAGTVVCAALSYFMLEKPLMLWSRNRR